VRTFATRALGIVLTAAMIVGCGSSGTTAPAVPPPSPPDSSVASLQTKVNHVIVIYMENWSFDALFGNFPGANGYSHATPASLTQYVCTPGTTTYAVMTKLPQAFNPQPGTPASACLAPAGTADTRIPAGMPVQPYNLGPYVPVNATTGDILHAFWHHQLDIDNGVLEAPGPGGAYSGDKYVTWSPNPGMVFSYYDATNMVLGQLAQQFVLEDNFYHSAYGGSFLNHQWLVCACTPVWGQALPASRVNATTGINSFVAYYQPATKTLNDPNLTTFPIQSTPVMGTTSPAGTLYDVNTTFSPNTGANPNKGGFTVAADQLVQPLTNRTIGDELTDNTPSISWKWYSGGWNDALAGHPGTNYQFHHQAFDFYARWGTDGSQAKSDHLQDESNFYSDIASGTLPNVVFIKPIGDNNDHPGYANIQNGQLEIQSLVQAVQGSQYWKDSIIIITYDEFGGHWDHQSPPPLAPDGFGPGARVPTVIVSAYAKRGFIDHAQAETVSILSLIEKRWNLAPLSARDAVADPLLEAFDFNQVPQSLKGTNPAPAVLQKSGR